jgi:hypothetical protein
MRELSTRRFFMHPAHRTIGVSAGNAAWKACRELAGPAVDGAPRPRRVCLLGPPGEKSLLASFLLGEHLRPETLALDDCDCLILLPGAIELEDWHLRCIRRYSRGGGAMVVLAVAGLTLPERPELARELTGGRCRPLRSVEPCRIVPAAAARHHPILSGVEPFCCRADLAAVAELSADARVLLSGSGVGRTAPVAWVRQEFGRVFSTTLGDGDECLQPGFIRLLLNAVAWTCQEP